MNVPPEILKCVAFVGAKKVNGEYEFFGSAFIVGFTGGRGYAEQVFFVTARHVIQAIQKKGATQVWLRVNLKDGNSAWVETALGSWAFHPTDASIDVSIVELGIGSDLDHLVFPIEQSATREVLAQHEAGHGDEVFITGLFRHHTGARRNIPIVRVGNVSCISKEKIRTKDFGEIEGYLIEARSVGGLSGSPVFINMGGIRFIGGSLKMSAHPVYFFLGLIHGHFDIKAAAVDAAQEVELSPERVNTGIAIVTPFEKVSEVISEYRKTGAQSKAIIQKIKKDA